MIFCLDKILAHYYDQATNKYKVAPEKIKELFNEVSDLHEQGMSQRMVKEMVASISKDMNVDLFYDLSRLRLQEDKLTSLKQFTHQISYAGDLNNAVRDMFLPSAKHAPGIGESITNLKYHYGTLLGKNMPAAIISRDGGLLYAQMDKFTTSDWTEVLSEMLDPKISDTSNPIAFLADIFNHQNNFVFGEKSKLGVPDYYNKNYGFKISYDGDKMKEAGLRKFSLDLIDSTKFKNSEVTDEIAGTNDGRLRRTMELLRDPKTTEAQIRKIVTEITSADVGPAGEALTKLKAQYSHDLLKSVVSSYDTWIPEKNGVFSSSFLDDPSGIGKGFSIFKRRQWDFSSPKHQMMFMEAYGRHGNNIFDYIKSDADNLSTQFAFIDKFGPNVAENWDNIKDYMVKRSLNSGEKFNAQEAQMLFDFSANRYHRVPTFKEANGAMETTSVVMKHVTNLTSAAVLTGSGLTQMLLDPANVATQMLFKSKQNLGAQVGTFMGQYLLSLKDAISKNPTHFMEIADIAERTFGEAGMMSTFKENFTGGLANVTTKYSASQFFNKTSAILSFRIINHMIKGGYIDNAEPVLARYGMAVRDLEFIQPLLSMVESPAMLRNLPDEHFVNNPLGMRPNPYKEKINKALSLYMEENRRQFATQVGPAGRYTYTLFNNDETHPASIIMKAVMHLKATNIKQLADYNQLAGIKAAPSSGANMFMRNPLTGKATIYSMWAMGAAVGGFSIAYLKELFRNSLSVEETQKSFFEDHHKKPAMWKNAFISSAIRYGAGGMFLEPLTNAQDAQDVMGNIISGSPAVKGVAYPTYSMGVAGMNYVLGKEPITYKNAQTFVDGLKVVVPFSSALNLTPLSKKYTELTKEWTKTLEHLDGK